MKAKSQSGKFEVERDQQLVSTSLKFGQEGEQLI